MQAFNLDAIAASKRILADAIPLASNVTIPSGEWGYGRLSFNSRGATYYKDNDQHGFGDATQTVEMCGGAPTGYVDNNEDCNDNNATLSTSCDANGAMIDPSMITPASAMGSIQGVGCSLSGRSAPSFSTIALVCLALFVRCRRRRS